MTSAFMLGDGGHASVVAWTWSGDIAGWIVPDHSAPISDRQLTQTDALRTLQPEECVLLNGVGFVGRSASRKELFELFVEGGFSFPTVCHTSAVLAGDAQLGPGVQVLAMSMVGPAVHVGANAILNSGSIIEHGSRIGAHAHVAPGATIGGEVSVGDGAMIGAASVVLPGLVIGEGAAVGAGAVVTRDVKPGVTVVGTPARSR